MGSDALTDCNKCPSGTYSVITALGDEDLCVACPENTYFPSTGADNLDNCLACDANAISPQESTALTACRCKQGFTREDWELCVECELGTYKDTVGANTCTLCPANFFGDELGADALSDCQACPLNSTSLSGSTTVDDCLCDDGYYE